MANEQIVVVGGSAKTLESNGGAISSGSIVQANDASYSISADGSSYPDVEFALAFQYTTGPTEGTFLVLCARPLNFSGTNDAEAPEATRQTQIIGVFEVNNVTTAQYALLRGGYAENVPREADYYIWNNGTGQQVNSGWTLTALARTTKPA